MQVDYVSHMGDDLMVVNAARVSFAKHVEEFGEGDAKLVKYLASHGHWTPFSHPQISVRVKAPIFVARQLFKHKVGFTENEVSRRYVDDEPEFFFPEEWRKRPTDGKKQGSSATDKFSKEFISDLDTLYSMFLIEAERLYEHFISVGVAPEQARMLLPQSMETEWYWTGSLSSFARMCKLRLDPHAQQESREIAKMIADIIAPLFPVCWSVLVEE